MNQGAL